MCVSMSDKTFDAEACDIGGQASVTNGLSDIETHIKNALCNRPLNIDVPLLVDFMYVKKQLSNKMESGVMSIGAFSNF
jgi:hypothetical protein